MCGIIGIASNKSVSMNIINALKKLEYRGYDSAGLATISNGTIDEKKCPGRVEKLEKILFQNPSEGNLGIGHVRWATHGVPNEVNAHPHSSEIVSVVHNGIIENSNELKKLLEKEGKKFKSQTDTEVITVLLTEKLKNLEPLKAVFETLSLLKGSFALGIIFKNQQDYVIGARRGSPLAVGYSNNENYLGSDSYALKSMTNKISYLDDGDVCILSKDEIKFYNSKKEKINKEIFTLSEDKSSVSKGNFKNFMIKEIFEQPTTAKTCLKEYIDKIREEINFYNLPIDPKKINKIVLIGCGTAYHSCLVAKYWLEEFTSLNVETDIASEFRYRRVRFNRENLYIFISQSGETADTFAALDLCKKENVKTCSIVNVVESSIARHSDCVMPIHAGPEIGVASTKAFLGQMLVLYLLSLKISEIRKDIETKEYKRKINELKKIPDLISDSLKQEEKIQLIAKDIYKSKGSMFLGRGLSYPIALEGALKLKELSYLHAEGYPAGEMKHGPLALIEDGLPVVVIAPKDKYFEKTLSNMQEVIARGGKVLLLTNSGSHVVSENIRFQIDLPLSDPTLTPFLFTIPLQLLSYHVALFKKCDIDKPRNLAKSVTVE
ncbi:MAG: glutamine--fructose-6-phosphate transaminase (isomerizing) [Pelagibacteraceae bacterium TMED247]|nr:glutamine--fructose-6-phosphate transaminase (isomerizing) [Candidatus Pelagibacter sp.]RPG05557.1 MAG: glutamine--fructose-6-phosphate transaminase (isomerizing) [Pelagibacteraceae bacterium TMED247]|tara:strand:+ start:19730 stop:21547 length:1818 start_codon:yes stop_codon:yes gene_type:complete